VKEMEKARFSAFVFPGQRKGKPLSNMAFLTLLKRMNARPKGEKPDPDAIPTWHDPASGRAITAHGFRATFKTWAEEVATFPHAVIERAMGHKVGGKVERLYPDDSARSAPEAHGRLGRVLRTVQRRRKGHAVAEESLAAREMRGDRPASRQAREARSLPRAPL